MKLLKYIATISALSLAAFFLHKLILESTDLGSAGASKQFSLEVLYAGYLAFAILLTIVLTKVRTINLDYVGYTFIALTGFKMLASFGVFYASVHAESDAMSALEKKNILAIFIFFLAVETVVAIRILNSRQ